MGRLRAETLERMEKYADRVLDVADVIESQHRSRRIVDQLSGSGTSAGANVWEADEAMSAADFCKTLGVVVKELNETRFWLRIIARREWIKTTRLSALEAETTELKRIFGSMIVRTRKSAARKRAA
jgi:four helix bundle protein